MSEVAIGVDLGGTNIRFGAADSGGKVVLHKKVRTEAGEGLGPTLARIEKGIDALIKRAGSKGHKVIGIGIGVPGIISPADGVVHVSPNLPGWHEVPLKNVVSSTFPLPVFVENDANAYALGEAWSGAGRGVGSLVCMTLGTGVGGGLILDGKIWRGADGMAGEVGHMTVDPDGPLCPCGNFGCLERYSSATAVIERLSHAIQNGEKTKLKKQYDLAPEKITPEMIADAAEAGDKLARRVYEDAGRYLGIAIASLINLLNVEMVILGGGLSGAWDLFIGPLTKEVELRAFEIPAKRCRIVRGRLGDDAGVLGAAGLVFMGDKS